eukprot:TRINITY_DN9426_c0_g1_i1.p1 TRINITY_DN9426_c0_g1~~TRINITY_DN9426_c0_g1_i1.p1  ORF type:complete len:172 (+),score=59.96 TRINITY_DN9426_c0_g1_i1:64-516(+)
MSIGVPIKLIHECEGHIVTIELKSGELYRGTLVEAEDNMNCEMAHVELTARNGRKSHLERCYIRGSHVRFVVMPDMLKNAPMFKKFGQKQAPPPPMQAQRGGMGGESCRARAPRTCVHEKNARCVLCRRAARCERRCVLVDCVCVVRQFV